MRSASGVLNITGWVISGIAGAIAAGGVDLASGFPLLGSGLASLAGGRQTANAAARANEVHLEGRP